MSPEQIAAVAGVILSLLLEYLPYFSDWYNAQPDNIQRLIVLAIGAVVVGGAFGLGCLGLVAVSWPCSWAGGWQAVLSFISFILSSQATYLVLPKPERG